MLFNEKMDFIVIQSVVYGLLCHLSFHDWAKLFVSLFYIETVKQMTQILYHIILYVFVSSNLWYHLFLCFFAKHLSTYAFFTYKIVLEATAFPVFLFFMFPDKDLVYFPFFSVAFFCFYHAIAKNTITKIMFSIVFYSTIRFSTLFFIEKYIFPIGLFVCFIQHHRFPGTYWLNYSTFFMLYVLFLFKLQIGKVILF